MSQINKQSSSLKNLNLKSKKNLKKNFLDKNKNLVKKNKQEQLLNNRKLERLKEFLTNQKLINHLFLKELRFVKFKQKQYKFKIVKTDKMFKLNKNQGISFSGIKFIFNSFGVNQKNILKLKPELLKKINVLSKDICDDYSIKNKLREIIKFYINLKNYKGLRHSESLPVRGQRTHTNARTRKKQRKNQSQKNKWIKKSVKNNTIKKSNS